MAKQQLVIILEGVDKVGKTTIGYELSKLLKIPYYKGDRPQSLSFSYSKKTEIEQRQLISLLRQTKYDLIIDRGYPSEWVYSQAYHRDTDFEMLRKIFIHFNNLNVLIIYLTAPYEVIKKRFRGREYRVKQNKIAQLQELYEKFFAQYRGRVMKFDTSKMTVDKIVEKIKKGLKGVYY